MQVANHYRADIDGLRAIAVLSVVAFHAFPSWLQGGFVGVDIFFVISGYLISTIIFNNLHLHAEFSLSGFYARRIKRIFPALILVMTACYVFGWFALSAEEYTQLGKHIAGGSGFVSNFVLWNETGYFDKTAELKPLQHLWSLGIEEQFYLAWPLLVYLAWKRRINLLMLTLVIAVTSFTLNIKTVQHDSISVFYMPAYRIWELMTGSLLAYLTLKHSYRPNRWLQHAMTIVGLSCIITSIFIINKTLAFPGWWALLPTTGVILMIAAGPTAWINQRILSHPLMVWFGLISFPLYLWHWPLLSFTQILESGEATHLMRFIAVFISMLLAWITYQFLEKPIRFGKYSREKTITLCALMIAIGFTGMNTFKHDGLKFRSSVQAVAAQQSSFEWGPEKLADANCKKKFPYEWGMYYFCLHSNPAHQPSAIIIGDSHANHLYWGLTPYYQHNNQSLLLLSGSGCFPFFNTESAMSNVKDRCHELMNTSLAYAEKSKEVKTIILHNYSNNQTVLSPLTQQPNQSAHQYIKYTPAATHTNYQEEYRLAMIATLSRLVKSKKEIIYIMDVPDLDFDPKSCVDVRPLRLTNHLKSPCAVSKQEYAKRNAAYLAITMSVLKSFPTVKVFDPSKYLCDAKYCWAMRDGKVLYADSNHLSYEGSMYVGKMFAREFAITTVPG